MYLGDIVPGQVLRDKFTTVQASGAPFTLAGTPALVVYKDSSTAENSSAITLTADFDGKTGMNHWTLTTALDPTFYSSASDFQVAIGSGTVNSVSVVGYVVAAFSIQNRSALRPTTAGRTLTIESDGMAHADLKEWLGVAPSALISGRVDANMQAVADGVLTAAKFAAGAFDAVWTVATRTLTSFGTLVADVATAVWAAAARTLTAFTGFTINTEVTAIKAKTDNLPPDPADASDIATAFGLVPAAVWSFGSRTLTSFGTLVADIWAGVTQAFYGKFFTQDSGETYASSVAGSVVKEIADNAGSGTNDVNVITIGGLAQPVTKLVRSSRTIVLGTVGAAATTTVIPTSALDPAAAIIGQFNGRVVIFDETTATATLRGCAATIESSAADGTLTLLAAEVLPAAPASGDTFVIV